MNRKGAIVITKRGRYRSNCWKDKGSGLACLLGAIAQLFLNSLLSAIVPSAFQQRSPLLSPARSL
ncbi:MAG: hypothetical protein ACAF41_29590 [Leptolyngbya sp. BL-A-14]